MEEEKAGISLTEGSAAKSLVLFALPLLGANLVQQLYNTVDLLFVGRALGSLDSAAVGASSFLISCMVGFFGGLAVGVNVVISSRTGAGDMEGVRRTVHTAAAISLIGGVLLAALGIAAAPWFISAMGTPAEIADSAVSYLRIYLLSLPAMLAFNMGSGVIRALGDAKRPMLVQLAGGLTNVAADAVFLFVFKMGVDGVAWATMLSQGLSAVLMTACLCSLPEECRLRPREVRISRETAAEIFRLGVPCGIQALVKTLSNVFVQNQINTFDTNVIAAFTIYYKVELMLYLPIVALGQAATTFVGQNLGAGKKERAIRGVRLCLVIGTAVAAASSAALLLWGEGSFLVFDPDEVVAGIGRTIIFTTFPFYWLYVFLEVWSAAIRSSGDSSSPMAIILANMCVLRTALLLTIMPRWHDVRGVALVYPASWLSSAVFLGLRYRACVKNKLRSGPLPAEREMEGDTAT